MRSQRLACGSARAGLLISVISPRVFWRTVGVLLSAWRKPDASVRSCSRISRSPTSPPPCAAASVNRAARRTRRLASPDASLLKARNRFANKPSDKMQERGSRVVTSVLPTPRRRERRAVSMSGAAKTKRSSAVLPADTAAMATSKLQRTPCSAGALRLCPWRDPSATRGSGNDSSEA